MCGEGERGGRGVYTAVHVVRHGRRAEISGSIMWRLRKESYDGRRVIFTALMIADVEVQRDCVRKAHILLILCLPCKKKKTYDPYGERKNLGKCSSRETCEQYMAKMRHSIPALLKTPLRAS